MSETAKVRRTETILERVTRIVGAASGEVLDRSQVAEDSFIFKFDVNEHGVADAQLIIRRGKTTLMSGALVLRRAAEILAEFPA